MTNNLLDRFINTARSIKEPLVLELGTKRSIPNRSTKHDEWVPHAKQYLGTDIEGGVDVDIVADIHQLSNVVGKERFDIIISCSTFEHFKYPHLAAHQVMKALRLEGLLFIQTHQTFPIHAFPFDFFRFSREAISGLFGTRMGFKVIETDYEFPAKIHSDRDPHAHLHESYLNVRLFGKKISSTPDQYIYEL